MKISRSILFATVTAFAVVSVGCGIAPTTTTATRLYNHWIGYCYVYPGQSIDSWFALTGAGATKPTSYMVTGKSGVSVGDFSISGQPSVPWSTVTLDWSLSQTGRHDLLPLQVTMTSSGKETHFTLGKWYVDVLRKPSAPPPLVEKGQSVGETLTEMPDTYPFSIHLHVNGPAMPQDLSLITNADPHVVKIVASHMTRTGRELSIRGVVSFINKSNQMYLIPALSYRYGQTKYVQPLSPMVFSIFPSSNTQSFSEKLMNDPQ